jgi:hypothetical protein
MKANRKGASQETAKDETLGVRRTPRASSDASTSGSATEVAFYDEEGNYNFDASKLSEYHRCCLDATKVSLENGYTVIVSNTFTSEWELEPYVNLAKSMDIPVQIITVQSNFKSIHNVPAETLEKQKARMKSCDVEKLLND